MMKIGAAQSQTNYSTIIAGSNWDVPAANLLGYVASTTSGLSNATPLGDQTTWGCQLGVNGCTTTSTSGMKVTSVVGGTTSFVGSATGVFALGPITFIPSYASISGTVAPSGQISMVFTPTNSSGVITGTASCVSTATLAWTYSETGGANGEMRIYVNSVAVETRTNTSSGTWTGLETGDEIYVEVELLGACSGFDDAGNVYSTSNRGTLTDAACFVASTGTYTSPTYTVVAGDLGATITLDTFASCDSGCL